MMTHAFLAQPRGQWWIWGAVAAGVALFAAGWFRRSR